MPASYRQQVELQHRDDPEDAGDPGSGGEHKDDPVEADDTAQENDTAADADVSDNADSDNVYDADDMLEQMEDDTEALAGGAWYASCSRGHEPWTIDRPLKSYQDAQVEASKHDLEKHNGDPTATVSN